MSFSYSAEELTSSGQNLDEKPEVAPTVPTAGAALKPVASEHSAEVTSLSPQRRSISGRHAPPSPLTRHSSSASTTVVADVHRDAAAQPPWTTSGPAPQTTSGPSRTSSGPPLYTTSGPPRQTTSGPPRTSSGSLSYTTSGLPPQSNTSDFPPWTTSGTPPWAISSPSLYTTSGPRCGLLPVHHCSLPLDCCC